MTIRINGDQISKLRQMLEHIEELSFEYERLEFIKFNIAMMKSLFDANCYDAVCKIMYWMMDDQIENYPDLLFIKEFANNEQMSFNLTGQLLHHKSVHADVTFYPCGQKFKETTPHGTVIYNQDGTVQKTDLSETLKKQVSHGY